MAWPAVNKSYRQNQFIERMDSLVFSWRPTYVMLHNTWAPSMQDWIRTALDDIARGLIPGTTRMNNLEHFFRYQQKWPGCPQLFIAPPVGNWPALIWEANQLNKSGIGSPSYNYNAIHIEMVADFSREDDDTGIGLMVRRQTVFVANVICSTLGIDPRTHVILHKDDPRTTHDCPGIDFAQDKQEVINEIMELMEGGEHDPKDVQAVIRDGDEAVLLPKTERKGIVNTNDLNVRVGPGASNKAVTSLYKGQKIDVLDSARNGRTEWLRIRTPGGYTDAPGLRSGLWVAGRYIDIQ